MPVIHSRIDENANAILIAAARERGVTPAGLAAKILTDVLMAGGDSAGFSKIHERISDHASAISRIEATIDEKFARLAAEIGDAKRAAETASKTVNVIARGLAGVGDKLGVPIVKLKSAASPSAAPTNGDAPAAKSGA